MDTCRARVVAALFVLATVAAQGCRRSDLGTPCRLSPGGDPIDTAALAQKKDFILFGAPECEELVCLRDRDSELDGGLEGLFWGYCSAACLPEGEFCSRAADMHCRAVLPDETAVVGPATPGRLPDPYYCVRGAADAGPP